MYEVSRHDSTALALSFQANRPVPHADRAKFHGKIMEERDAGEVIAG
jgi:hypothetical protein